MYRRRIHITYTHLIKYHNLLYKYGIINQNSCLRFFFYIHYFFTNSHLDRKCAEDSLYLIT